MNEEHETPQHAVHSDIVEDVARSNSSSTPTLLYDVPDDTKCTSSECNKLNDETIISSNEVTLSSAEPTLSSVEPTLLRDKLADGIVSCNEQVDIAASCTSSQALVSLTNYTTDETTESSALAGFGLAPGMLKLVRVARRQWKRPQQLPLPAAAPAFAPITREWARTWRALRLRAPPLESRTKSEQPATTAAPQSLPPLLKSYEPRFSVGEHTFPCDVAAPSFLDARVAVEDAHAFLVSMQLHFALGSIEPLDCRLMLYDVSLGCRASEELCYTLPSAATATSVSLSSESRAPHSLFYALPNHLPQHLYVVLKVAKVLVGDNESATAAYVAPERFATETEQHKLVERAADCMRRLGRFRQSLAWGAIALLEGSGRPMTLYRQRTAMSDEQRLPLISEAVRGTLNVNPAGSTPTDTQLPCREVQPFCHATVVPLFGLTGCGPVATSYIHTMYLYPIHLEKFHYRNIAIRVQLLQHEAATVSDSELPDASDASNNNAVLAAVYAPNHAAATASAYTLVNYHQRNPQFENEIKLCLPERLTRLHHVLFTFYHVHCKKLTPQQRQQDVVGYAVLPLLQRDGTIVADNHYVVNVIPTPIVAATKAATPLSPSNSNSNTNDNNVLVLPSGYVAAARDAALDSAKTTLAVRTRVLSSIHSQDRAVASFLQRFHANEAPPSSSVQKTTTTSSSLFGQPPSADECVDTDDTIVAKLLGLRLASTTSVRFFVLPIAKFVFGFLRYGAPIVRWAAFRALLTVLEKASWTPHRSLKQDANTQQLLHTLVHVVFDEDAIELPPGGNTVQTSCAAAASQERQQPHALFHALLVEWLRVLQDDATIDDNVETKRLALAYSNMLLQLVLKSMAMHLLRPRTTGSSTRLQLPLALARRDAELTECVACELIRSVGTTSLGLLLQKEVNRSIATFCRGLFLVVCNRVSARIVTHYVRWAAANQTDANVLVHLLFPFLRIVIEFEFFAVVTGAKTSLSTAPALASMPPPQPRAWLVQLVLERLLRVVDEQREAKIRADAVRLLRRMFVAQVYNPYHASVRDQEAIALLYYPFVARVAQLTADGKLLCSGSSCMNAAATVGVATIDDAASDKTHELKKELLICVVHLLSSVSTHELVRFFQAVADTNDVTRNGNNAVEDEDDDDDCVSASLRPTQTLVSYRQLVDAHVAPPRQQQQLQHNVAQVAPLPTGAAPHHEATSNAHEPRAQHYDEVRVHACLALIRHAIETFLVDASTLSSSSTNQYPLWHQLLSPDLVTREGRLSLFDIELHLQHRRVSRQRNSVSNDSATTGAAASASTATAAATRDSGSTSSLGASPGYGLHRHSASAIATSGLRSPTTKLVMPTSASSNAATATTPTASAAAASVSSPRTVATNKSLPRNWGKPHAGVAAANISAANNQRRVTMDSKLGGTAAATTTTVVAPAASTAATNTSFDAGASTLAQTTSSIDNDADSDDYDAQIQNVHRITATTALRALQTAVDAFAWVLHLIDAPFDCMQSPPRVNTNSSSNNVTIAQSFALLGALVDLLFLLLQRAETIESLYRTTNNNSNNSAVYEEDSDDSDDPEATPQHSCFLVQLFVYLEAFTTRFQRALFATRIPQLPVVYDEPRVALVLRLAAMGRTNSVKQRAARLLCLLLTRCFVQTGSFALLHHELVSVFCRVFFASTPGLLEIPTEALRDAIDEMRQQQRALAFRATPSLSSSTASTGDTATYTTYTTAFMIQFHDLLNGLATQLKVVELWRAALAHPELVCDAEAIEDALVRVARTLSPHGRLAAKTSWLDALLQLHVARQQFAEAACCKLDIIACTKRAAVAAAGTELEETAFGRWHVRELIVARALAERAEWLEQQIALSETLLESLRRQRRLVEYSDTLQYIAHVTAQLTASESTQSQARVPASSTSNADVSARLSLRSAFYRVAFAGDCVSPLVAAREFIYRRGLFVSLGEFVSELKAALRVTYPLCERVDVVPESRPRASDNEPNVVYLRVTSVECCVHSSSSASSASGTSKCDPVGTAPGTVFTFATPFTRGGSAAAYGKSSEQMKRVTRLVVALPFPCATSRQVVLARTELLRCPIETAMDDIAKRCALLEHEIENEQRGCTDLKTLTLVLKGSVDTHVHGGIPEVVESFLAAAAVDAASIVTSASRDDNNERLSPLLDARGGVMDAHESARQRLALANLLAHFLWLCWRALRISRDAFRRAAAAATSSSSSSSSHLPAAAAAVGAVGASAVPSTATSSTTLLTLSSSVPLDASAVLTAPFEPATAAATATAQTHDSSNKRSSVLDADDFSSDDYDSSNTNANMAPLQLEFEKSFAALVALVQRRIVAFPFACATDVTQLLRVLQRKHVGGASLLCDSNTTGVATSATPTATH